MYVNLFIYCNLPFKKKIIKIKDIHHCKETGRHIYAIVRTGHGQPTTTDGLYRGPGSHGNHVGDPWFGFSMLLASVVQPRALLSCVSVMLQATDKYVFKSEGPLALADLATALRHHDWKSVQRAMN